MEPGRIKGEYWVIDGFVQFADGDIGDQNHEMIAADYVAGQYIDQIKDLADELEIDTEELDNGYDDNRSYVVSQILDAIHTKIEDLMDNDVLQFNNIKEENAWIMQKIGCNQEAYAILSGRGDGRLYVMKEGWIAIRSNNVELYGYSIDRQKEIADAIFEILCEEGQEYADPEQTYLVIDDHSTGRSLNVTLEDLMQQEGRMRPNQTPTTVYNKNITHIINPRDEVENYPTTPSGSQTNPWKQAARKTGIIGPGQDLWRGTSEGTMTFKQFFEMTQ